MENAIRRLETLKGLSECDRTQIYVKLATSLNSHLLDLITATNLKDEKLLITLKSILYQPPPDEQLKWTEKLSYSLKEIKEQQIQFIQQQQNRNAILEKLSQQELQDISETEADESSEDETVSTTISGTEANSVVTPAPTTTDSSKTTENLFSIKKIVNCIVITSIMLFIGFLGDYIPLIGKALSWLVSGYYLCWTLEQLNDVNSIWIIIVSYVWKIDIFSRISLRKNKSKTSTISSSSTSINYDNKKKD